MQFETRLSKEREVGVNCKRFRTAFAESFLWPELPLGIMVILSIFGVLVLAASGHWIIAAGVVTFAILLGFIIQSLFRQK